jgi:hypothetical protein
MKKHFLKQRTSDTNSKVIHQTGERSLKIAQSSMVNNFAAGHTGDDSATLEPRLARPHPARVRMRSPAPVTVSGPSAERTSPLEGSCIRSRPSRRPTPMRTARRMNTDWNKHSYFAALDWASDHHDVVVVDRIGAIVADFRFTHNATGWAEFSSTRRCREKP